MIVFNSAVRIGTTRRWDTWICETASYILDILNKKINVRFTALVIMLYTNVTILEATINYSKRKKERKKEVAVFLNFKLISGHKYP
jgi:hypothetical protein